MKQAFEPRSPGRRQRLEMVRTLSEAGLMVGISLMPIIPFLGDSDKHLEDVIRAASDHGAKFVIAGGMTMDGNQAERTLKAAGKIDPGIESKWRELYNQKKVANAAANENSGYSINLARRVRSSAEKYSAADRIPRYIPEGPLRMNKLLAEKLFLKMRDLELEWAPQSSVWKFRKAAWTVDEMDRSIVDLYRMEGIQGLILLTSIAKNMAVRIEKWLVKHKMVEVQN